MTRWGGPIRPRLVAAEAVVQVFGLIFDLGNTETNDLLVTVSDWFTKGFDTADLKEAQQLLDELS